MNAGFATKIFSSLSHQGRLDLLRKLVVAGSAGLTVGELAALTEQNIKTISAQLKILADAGVLSFERKGKEVTYRAEFQTLSEVIAYLINDCCRGDPALRKSVTDTCCR